jgi:hypothetical protein
MLLAKMLFSQATVEDTIGPCVAAAFLSGRFRALANTVALLQLFQFYAILDGFLFFGDR